MANIKLGNGYDESRSSLSITTDGGAGLNVDAGARYDKAQQDVVIHHSESAQLPQKASRARQGAIGRSDPPPNQLSAARIWAIGSFFIIAVAALATVYTIVAQNVSLFALPIVVVAALLCVYLIALFLVSKENEKGIVGFQKVLTEYIKLIVGKSRKVPH